MDNISYYLESKRQYKRAIPTIVSILLKKVGEEKATKQIDLLGEVRKELPEFKIRALRFALHEIRVKHLIPGLVANNSGFYIETNAANILKYITRLDGYIKSMTAAKKAIVKDMLILNNRKKQAKKWHPKKPNSM